MRVLRVYHGGRDPAHRARDRGLVAAGVELTTVVPRMWAEGGAQDVLTPETWPVLERAVLRSGDVNRHTYADPAAISDLIRAFRPDVLDLHEEPFAAVTRQWLQRAPAELPVVAYSAQNIDKRWPPPFAQWERRALARLAGVYPCSRQAASVLRGKGFNGLLRVLPLGLDDATLYAGEQRHDDPVWTLLLVGRLVPEKGVQEAVRLLARIREVKDCRLVVVGRGPEADRIPGLAAELGVADHVEVRPWVDAEGLAALYRTAHVALLPSRATRTWVEQFGRVITEGQASGAVVVGCASGSIPEVGAGLVPLAPEADVDALAARVRELVEDRELYERLRDGGLKRAAQISWTAVGAEQAAFYEQARAAPRSDQVVRPQRARAVQEFGRPAEVAGGGRPFALPVLRENRSWTRLLGQAVDVVEGVRAKRTS